ncbi:hypothetical protein [Blastococcus sp. SYSU D00820]
MTASTRTEPSEKNRAAKEAPEESAAVRQEEPLALPASPDREVRELVRTQDDVAQRARRLVAGELLADGANGGEERHRVDRLLEQARTQLRVELQEQEQERARRQLQEAARSGEEAVEGVVQSLLTIVRSVVPPVLVRPEQFIEASFALADQGLRVGRRLALTVAGGARGLAQAA